MFDNWSDRTESRLNAEIQQQWKQIAIASWLEITSGWRRVRVLDDGIEEVTPDQVQALAERCEWAQLENRNTGWSRLERTPYGYQHAIELRLGWGWCVAASQRLDPSRHGEYRFYAYLLSCGGGRSDARRLRNSQARTSKMKRLRGRHSLVLRNIKRLPPPGRSSWFLGELHLGDESEQ